MSKNRKGLGKGLDALLGDSLSLVRASGNDNQSASESGGPETVVQLELDRLQPGDLQPRKVMDESALHELADSIRAQGVVQPIVVRPLVTDAKRFEIVAGERRWRAARIAGLGQIPALVRPLEDRAVLAIGIIENIQREGLNPIDEAQALARLIAEVGLTHEQCAEAVGRSRAAVSNMLRLLNLSTDVQDMLRQGLIEMGHGRCLLALEPVQQEEIAHRISGQGLTVRETEALVRRLTQPVGKAPVPVAPEIEDRAAAQRDRLAERIRAKVQLRPVAGGGGKLVINYGSGDQLDAIFESLLKQD